MNGIKINQDDFMLYGIAFLWEHTRDETLQST